MSGGVIGLKAIFSADDKMSPTVARMTSAIRGLNSAGDGLGKLDRFNAKVTSGLKTAALSAAGLGAAVGLAAWDVVGSSATFEDSLAKVTSVVTPMSGTVVDATERMKGAAIGWSKAHRDSATSFLDSTYMMLSAGLNERAAIEATRTAMTVATATFGDGAEAAALIATVYNNMGDKTRDVGMEMSRLGDIITKTQQTFQFANLDQLNEGLKYGIPTALQYGIKIDELSTVIGELNNAGLQGSMAGTAFSATMRSMTSGAKALGFAVAKTAEGGFDFGGTLQNIEHKFGSLSKMSDATRMRFQKAFGDEGFRGLSLMIGKSDELGANLKKVHDSAGVSKEAAGGIESKGTNRFKILENNVEALKISLGEGLAPAVDRVLGRVLGVTNATGEWTDANKQLITANVTKFVDDAIPAIENFAHQLKDGWHDVAPILRGVGSAISWANDKGLSENIVKIGLGWAAFSGGVKVTRGVIGTVGTGLKMVRGAADFIGTTKDTFNAFRLATNAGPKGLIAMSDALNGIGGAAGKVGSSALAAEEGIAGIGATAGLAVLPILAVAAAIAAVLAAGYNAVQFANENGGLEGVGGFLGIGTSDWGFEGVDQVMNRRARQRAGAEGRLTGNAPQPWTGGAAAAQDLTGTRPPQGYAGAFGIGAPAAPGPWAGDYGMPAPPPAPPAIAQQPAITQETLHAAVSQALEVTIRTPDGAIAEVTKKPKGAKVNLQPSGTP